MADHGGNFPNDFDALRQLPGLGDYTAASIAAIAFEQPVAVVDANVERVMARLYAIATPLPAARTQIRAILAPLVPAHKPGDFAQAMMDLGATICTVRNPACALCPLHTECAAFGVGMMDRYPVKLPKVAKPERHGIAFWVEQDGKLLLVRRPDTGLLGGMLGLPGPEWQRLENGAGPPPIANSMGRVVHVFTHFRLTLDIVAHNGAGQDAMAMPIANIEYWDIDKLVGAGLPTLYAKAVQAILAQKG
jgi:A/G-specific adenine glycosylase